MTPLDMPRRFRRILHDTQERDTRYFERHPECTAYLRRYVDGEFWPFHLPHGTKIMVMRFGLMGRARITQVEYIPYPGYKAQTEAMQDGFLAVNCQCADIHDQVQPERG